MKRAIYQLLMSVLVGTVVGGVVTNLVNIMDPEIEIDYGVAMAFFAVITWGALSVIDTLFRKPEQPASAATGAPVTPTAPRR
jgi:hypothetical protein